MRPTGFNENHEVSRCESVTILAEVFLQCFISPLKKSSVLARTAQKMTLTHIEPRLKPLAGPFQAYVAKRHPDPFNMDFGELKPRTLYTVSCALRRRRRTKKTNTNRIRRMQQARRAQATKTKGDAWLRSQRSLSSHDNVDDDDDSR